MRPPIDVLPSPSVAEQAQRITAEIYKALGFSKNAWYNRLLNPIFRGPANRLSQIAAGFDIRVREDGFQEAARWVLPNFISDLRERGAQTIPREGPLLIASNHPGAADTICHVACISRNDVKIISSDVPFLRALPSLSEHMIPVVRDPFVGMGALRTSLRHLQNGGALLLFSTSRIDADLSIHPTSRALAEIETWSDSVEIFLKRVPKIQLVLAVSSGVMARSCWHNPLKYLGKTPLAQRRIAEIFQVMLQIGWGWKFNLKTRVSYSQQLGLDLVPDGQLMEEIKRRAKGLLSDHLAAISEKSVENFQYIN